MSSKLVVSYVRVSSAAQGHDLQRLAIERLAEQQNLKIDHWYAEKASGKNLERPIFQELRQAVQQGKIGRIYIWRLDRLTRSGIVDTLNVIKEFKDAGVLLVSVNDGFSLDGPTAEIVLACLSWSAAMERKAINERVQAARKRMEVEGRPWGKPAKDFDRAQALELRTQGLTIRAIAVKLGVAKSIVGRNLKER